jgi:hypothetical protein
MDESSNCAMLDLYDDLITDDSVKKQEDFPDKLYHIMLYIVHLAWERFELTTLLVICTDYIGTFFCSCKPNQHTITTTTASVIEEQVFYQYIYRYSWYIVESGVKHHIHKPLVLHFRLSVVKGLVCLPWVWSIMGLIPSQVKPGTMKLVFQFTILSTKHAVLSSGVPIIGNID